MLTVAIANVKPRLLSASCSAADKIFQRFAVRAALTHLPSSMSSQKLPLQQQRRGCAKPLALGVCTPAGEMQRDH